VYHGAVAAIALISGWIAFGAVSRSREAAAEVAAAVESLETHKVEADGVAAECGLPPFSDKKSLESFPMRIPPFPTKRESACAKKVTEARANLIEDHFKLEQATPRSFEASRTARRGVTAALGLAAVWAAGFYVLEIHFGRAASRRRGAP